MSRETDGWVVLVRSRAAKRGDTWTPMGDVDLEDRYEVGDKRGTPVMRRKAEQPEREATIYRQRHVAKAVAADVEAMGGQVVVLPVKHAGEKLVGREVEQLSVAAEAVWETKAA